jgi:hypothetical protein
MKMDDATVVGKLAERANWTRCKCGDADCPYNIDDSGFAILPLTSRDALAPILEGLSEDEWDRLAINVLPRIYHEKHPLRPVSVSRFLLTLPPRDLAYAIAEVLDKCQPAKHSIGA